MLIIEQGVSEMAVVNNDFRDVMLNRHSVRKFDEQAKIERSELTEMIAEAITAPSACNLQAWRFVVVDSPAGKDKLRSFFMRFNLPQLATASAVVMIFGDTLAFESYRDLWNKAYENGQITAAKRDEVLNPFPPLSESAPKSMLINDSMVDCSLAAMQLMLTARAHGYESNPIAGYDAKKAAPAFDLDPERYVPVMAIAIGKPVDEGVDKVTSSRYPVKDVMDFA